MFQFSKPITNRYSLLRMGLIQIAFTTFALIGLSPLNLMGYSVVVTLYQKSSEVIEFNATDQGSYIIKDFEPHIMKRYIIEDNSDDLDEFSFRVKDKSNVKTLDLNMLLEFGDVPYIKIGPHMKFLNGNVVYQLEQDYTWENLIRWDDTLYFTITFLDFQDFQKLLADKHLSNSNFNTIMDKIWSYIDTTWRIIRNDL